MIKTKGTIELNGKMIDCVLSINEEDLKENTQVEDKLHECTCDKKDMGNELNELNDIITPLKEILLKMFEIEGLGYELTYFNISPDDGASIKNCVLLSGITGNVYLALWIRQWFEIRAKKTGKTLDEQDLELIDLINSYYKDVNYIEMENDILFVPKSGRFDRKLVRDIKSPGSDFRIFEEVLVPGYNDTDKQLFTHAYVKGIK